MEQFLLHVGRVHEMPGGAVLCLLVQNAGMSVAELVTLLRRGSYYLRRQGVNRAVRRGAEELLPRLYLKEQHVWYERSVPGAGLSREWPPGVELVRAGAPQLHLLAQLDTINEVEARRRLADGAQWWLAIRSGEALFSCWLLFRRVPVLAARQGRIDLPAGHVVLEDSVTAPQARGLGIAPKAWSEIAASLPDAGVRLMLTKVAVANSASRRAVAKAGFTEFALVTHRRLGGWTRTYLLPLGTTAGWLTEALVPSAAGQV